jgi:hypothetical protein
MQRAHVVIADANLTEVQLATVFDVAHLSDKPLALGMSGAYQALLAGSIKPAITPDIVFMSETEANGYLKQTWASIKPEEICRTFGSRTVCVTQDKNFGILTSDGHRHSFSAAALSQFTGNADVVTSGILHFHYTDKGDWMQRAALLRRVGQYIRSVPLG